MMLSNLKVSLWCQNNDIMIIVLCHIDDDTPFVWTSPYKQNTTTDNNSLKATDQNNSFWWRLQPKWWRLSRNYLSSLFFCFHLSSVHVQTRRIPSAPVTSHHKTTLCRTIIMPTVSICSLPIYETIQIRAVPPPSCYNSSISVPNEHMTISVYSMDRRLIHR